MSSMDARSVCEVLTPPPLPPPEFEGYVEIVNFALKDETYLLYADMCNITLPRVPTTEPTTVSIKTTPSYMPSTPPLNETVASASPGVIVGIVLLIFVLIFILVLVVWYFCKRKDKRGSVNINSLPLNEYENTNYLANKAQAGQCWNPTTDTNQNSGNQYGSFPPANGNNKNQGMISTKLGEDGELHSQRGSSYEKSETIGYVNENFNKKDEDRATSPGVDSQTPLFDYIDGVLPNAVPPTGTEIDQLKSTFGVSARDVDSQPCQLPDEPGNGEIVELRSKKRKQSRSKSAEVQANNKEDLETRPKTVST